MKYEQMTATQKRYYKNMSKDKLVSLINKELNKRIKAKERAKQEQASHE